MDNSKKIEIYINSLNLNQDQKNYLSFLLNYYLELINGDISIQKTYNSDTKNCSTKILSNKDNILIQQTDSEIKIHFENGEIIISNNEQNAICSSYKGLDNTQEYVQITSQLSESFPYVYINKISDYENITFESTNSCYKTGVTYVMNHYQDIENNINYKNNFAHNFSFAAEDDNEEVDIFLKKIFNNYNYITYNKEKFQKNRQKTKK